MTGEFVSTAYGGAINIAPISTGNIPDVPGNTAINGYPPGAGQSPVFTRSIAPTTQNYPPGVMSGHGMNPVQSGMYASAPQLSSPSAGPNFGGTTAQDPAGWSRPPLQTQQVNVGAMGQFAIQIPDVAAMQSAPPSGTPSIGSASDVVLNMHPSSPVHSLLHGYFTPYMNIANQQQFHELIDERTRVLSAMGHDAERIAQNLDKANQLDWYAAATVGGIKASPFALATYFMDMYPQLLASANDKPAAQGLWAGTIAGATDVVGTGAIAPATSDTRWLHASLNDLAPPMQEAIKERTPQFMQQLFQNMALPQPYTGRNMVRTAAAPVMEMMGGKAVRTAVDTGLACVGGVVAGAATEAMARGFDKYNGLDGPALLFGRQDWEKVYRDLDVATWGSQTANGLQRVGRLPGDMITGLSALAHNVVQPSSGAEIGLLAGGLAGIGATRNAVEAGARAAGYSEPMVQVASHAVNTVLSVPMYAGLIPVMTGANKVGSDIAQALHNNGWTNRKPAPGVQVQVREVPARQLSAANSDLDDADDPSRPLTGGVPGALPFGMV